MDAVGKPGVRCRCSHGAAFKDSDGPFARRPGYYRQLTQSGVCTNSRSLLWQIEAVGAISMFQQSGTQEELPLFSTILRSTRPSFLCCPYRVPTRVGMLTSQVAFAEASIYDRIAFAQLYRGNRTANVPSREKGAKACLGSEAGHFLQSGLSATSEELRPFPAIFRST